MRCLIRRVLGGIDTFSNWTGKIVGCLVIVVMVLLLYEVVLRYVFNSPTRWVHEMTQMMFGGYFMLLGAYVLCRNGHISMDLLYSRWTQKLQAIMSVITSLLFFFFCGGLLYFGGKFAWNAVTILEHTRTAWGPAVYPFKLMIPVAAFLILLQGVAKFTRDLHMAITGKEL